MNDNPMSFKQKRHLGRTTRNGKKDVAAKVRAVALPWVAMVIASIVAAAYVTYQSNQEDDLMLDRLLQSQQRVHKPVFEENHKSLFPLSTNDKIGFSFAICGLMIAAGGGIGGGGILVPIYILVMGFSPKHGEYGTEQKVKQSKAESEIL